MLRTCTGSEETGRQISSQLTRKTTAPLPGSDRLRFRRRCGLQSHADHARASSMHLDQVLPIASTEIAVCNALGLRSTDQPRDVKSLRSRASKNVGHCPMPPFISPRIPPDDDDERHRRRPNDWDDDALDEAMDAFVRDQKWAESSNFRHHHHGKNERWRGGERARRRYGPRSKVGTRH